MYIYICGCMFFCVCVCLKSLGSSTPPPSLFFVPVRSVLLLSYFYKQGKLFWSVQFHASKYSYQYKTI